MRLTVVVVGIEGASPGTRKPRPPSACFHSEGTDLGRSVHRILMLEERTALAPAPTSQLDHQRLASEVLRACVLGDASAVRELLDQSAPVVPPALFAAVQGGHAEVVELLAANPNVDVNRCLANGCSPLFRAASLGHTDCAARLLDANAAVDAPSNGSSPLLVAK